jgi:hypothetical protein
MFFALRLLEILQGKETAQKVADAFLIPLIEQENGFCPSAIKNES